MKTKRQVIKEIVLETGMPRQFCEDIIYEDSMRKEYV